VSREKEKPGVRGGRRWVRRGIVSIAVLAVLLTCGRWYVTRSAFIVARVAPEISRKLGGPATIGEARYVGNGRFLMKDVSLRAEHIDGPAGEIAHVEEARVRISMDALFRGDVQMVSVDLHGVTLRLSERLDDPNQFNVMSLRPQWSAGTDTTAPPILTLHDAVVHFGRHDDQDFYIADTRTMTGEFSPSAHLDNTYLFMLRDVISSADDAVEAVQVEGSWDLPRQSFTIGVDNMRLDERSYRSCPQQVQVWWDRMQLEGTVGATASWGQNDPLHIQLELLDTGVTVPFETAGFWGRFTDGASAASGGAPRLRVDSGTISLTPDRLELNELRGSIVGSDTASSFVGVPYVISGALKDLPALTWDAGEAWTADAIATCPFEMQVQTEEFRLDAQGESHAGVELPRRVTDALERFQLRRWSLSTSFRVWRDAPNIHDSAPIHTTGTAFISEAMGMFDQFRYPLTNLSAYLEWDENQLTIHNATGYGVDDCVIKVTGRIAPLGKDPEIILNVRAQDLPVDDQLREALSPGRRETLESLIDHAAEQSLRDNGLWTFADDESGSGPFDEEHPPTLAGIIDLDLLMHRAAGPFMPLALTGTVRLPWFGMLYDRFPYPFWIRDGELHFFDDRIVIGSPSAGVKVVTAYGGAGVLGGTILTRVDGESGRTVPDIDFRIANDHSGPLIHAAIPMTDDEIRLAGEQDLRWPGDVLSTSAELLMRIGLDGRLDYTGHIGVDRETQRGIFDFEINLSDAVATPTTVSTPVMKRSPIAWPDALSLTDVAGTFFITRDGVRLEGLRGVRGDGAVICSADISLGDDNAGTSVNVAFDGVPIEPYLLTMAPDSGRDRLQRLADMFQPTGTYDAEYHYESRSGEQLSTLEFAPSELHLAVGEREVTLVYRQGALALESGGLVFRDLEFDVNTGNLEAGTLAIHGAYTSGDDEVLELAGIWENARLESPLVEGVLQLTDRDALLNGYHAASPVGRVDATFEYRAAGAAGDASERDYRIDIHPQTISTNVRSSRIKATFDPATRVLVTPGAIELHDVVGRTDVGTFDLAGTMTFSDIARCALRFNFAGDLRAPTARAFLPIRANEVLDTIAFADAGRSELRDARLSFIVRDLDTAPTVDDTEFTSTLHLRDASFTTGIEFTEVAGRFDVRVLHEAGTTPSVRIDAAADHLRALGQQLTRAVGTLTLPADSIRMRLDELTANMHGGVLWVEGFAMLGERGAYEFRVETIGAEMEGIFRDSKRANNVEIDEDDTVPRGAVYADVTLGGAQGDLTTRRGRGVLRIVGGRVADVPIALQLAHLLQFTLPNEGHLDYAEVDFYIDGTIMMMERILLESSSGRNATMQVFGDGRLDLETYDLHAWLHARSGILVLRDLVGGITDSFFRIEVTGTLGNPVASLVPAGSTSREPRAAFPPDLN
jgi:hypothetical protein